MSTNNESITIYLKNGGYFSGRAWRLTGTTGIQYEQDRAAILRSKQWDLLRSVKSDLTKAQEQELDELTRHHDEAKSIEEKAHAAATKEIKGWPSPLKLTSVQWNRPSNVIVRFDCGASIEYVASSSAEVTCAVPPLTFRITAKGAELE